MTQVIFDLDGTLSDNSHRHHLIEGENKEWQKYLRKCKEDPPINKAIQRAKKLAENHEIIIITARSDEVEEKTRDWLKNYKIPFDNLFMLPKGRWDVPDAEYKQELLQQLKEPIMAFDDKESNCKMFRQNGLETFIVDNDSEKVIKEFN